MRAGAPRTIAPVRWSGSAPASRRTHRPSCRRTARPAAQGGEIGARAVYRAAVDRDHGAGRPVEILGAGQIDRGHVAVADRAGPGAAVVAVLEDRTSTMAVGNAGQRPPLSRQVAQIDAERDRAVIGVRPRRNVLMPLYHLTGTRPFVIQLAAVEFDIGADKIGSDIGQHRVRREPPEIGCRSTNARNRRTCGRSAL